MKFDEDAYRKANPDVAAAIADGIVASGFEHWLQHGKSEGRPLRSRTDPDQGRIVISGTGRAGTTLLVQIFTALHFDTGFRPAETATLIDPISFAGLEHDLLPNGPLVVKSPGLADVLLERIRDQKVKVDYAIIPVRELHDAAESRRRVHEAAKRQNLDPRRYPGGLWKTESPSQQEDWLGRQFYKVVHALVETDTPLIFLSFPRFAKDLDYTFRKLSPILHRYEVSRDSFVEACRNIVRPDRIHIGG